MAVCSARTRRKLDGFDRVVVLLRRWQGVVLAATVVANQALQATQSLRLRVATACSVLATAVFRKFALRTLGA